jgi:hypothetical protein
MPPILPVRAPTKRRREYWRPSGPHQGTWRRTSQAGLIPRSGAPELTAIGARGAAPWADLGLRAGRAVIHSIGAPTLTQAAAGANHPIG